MGTLDKSTGRKTQFQATPPDLLTETQAALRDLTCYVTFHIGDRLDGCDGLTRVLSRAHRALDAAGTHGGGSPSSRSPLLHNL